MPVKYFWQPLICTSSDPAGKITKPIQKAFFLQNSLRRNTFRETRLVAVITSEMSCDYTLYVSYSVFFTADCWQCTWNKMSLPWRDYNLHILLPFPRKADIYCAYNKHYINRLWKHESLIVLLEHSVIIITNIYICQKYNSSLWMYDKIAVGRKPVKK